MPNLLRGRPGLDGLPRGAVGSALETGRNGKSELDQHLGPGIEGPGSGHRLSQVAIGLAYLGMGSYEIGEVLREVCHGIHDQFTRSRGV